MKSVLFVLTFLAAGYVLAQPANCWQQYVCGPAGCKWAVVCR
jgi:hypothetical protein